MSRLSVFSSPLLLGFDELERMLDRASKTSGDGYPPYNIERSSEDHYRITLALAGFAPEDVSMTAEQNMLTIEGKKTGKDEREYLYQGIAARPFRRVFNLADYVQVKEASFNNGLLTIELAREIPEAMKPRRISINGAAAPAQIDQRAA